MQQTSDNQGVVEQRPKEYKLYADLEMNDGTTYEHATQTPGRSNIDRSISSSR